MLLLLLRLLLLIAAALRVSIAVPEAAKPSASLSSAIAAVVVTGRPSVARATAAPGR
jgi:hypothetical protein